MEILLFILALLTEPYTLALSLLLILTQLNTVTLVQSHTVIDKSIAHYYYWRMALSTPRHTMRSDDKPSVCHSDRLTSVTPAERKMCSEASMSKALITLATQNPKKAPLDSLGLGFIGAPR